MVKLKLIKLDLQSYKFVNNLQQEIARKRIAGETRENILLVCEHSPTFTVGRRIKSYSDKTKLEQMGASFHYTKRGGDITFHGPGQLVVYPIINLKDFNV